VSEFTGRSVEHDGQLSLQVWISTAEHENMVLEVAPVDDLDAAWPLFVQLAEYRGVVPIEYRTHGPAEGFGEWKPIPGAPLPPDEATE